MEIKGVGPFTGFVALSLMVSASAPSGAGSDPSPLQRAISFLSIHQVARPVDFVVDGARVVDFPGNWPQHFNLQGSEAFRVRDVSPFTVAFIHHALTYVNEDTRRPLGLSERDLRAARTMRQRAVGFMKRFASAPGAPDAGTFAFWPYDADPATPGPLVTLLLSAWLQGPFLGGQRVPINMSIYPTTMAIPSDADVTATTYATLLDDARLDGGGNGHPGHFERFFVDWRDVGVVPRRLNPSWLPPASGAFLTWLTYRQPVFPLFPNDVDLVVNANVLYSLGRVDRLSVPGVAEAIELINLATALGLHNGHLEDISNYYPDNLAFQYSVSRAFYEGGVTALEPAVRIVADDLEASVQFRSDGTAYWDKGDPPLNTAFAVLTLLNAGRHTGIVERAVDYLVSQQDALGGFDAAPFFIANADGGQVFEFTSASFTTAIALEALARHALAHCDEDKAAGALLAVSRCK